MHSSIVYVWKYECLCGVFSGFLVVGFLRISCCSCQEEGLFQKAMSVYIYCRFPSTHFEIDHVFKKVTKQLYINFISRVCKSCLLFSNNWHSSLPCTHFIIFPTQDTDVNIVLFTIELLSHFVGCCMLLALTVL